jgi:hypothetical protein
MPGPGCDANGSEAEKVSRFSKKATGGFLAVLALFHGDPP